MGLKTMISISQKTYHAPRKFSKYRFDMILADMGTVRDRFDIVRQNRLQSNMSNRSRRDFLKNKVLQSAAGENFWLLGHEIEYFTLVNSNVSTTHP